MRNMIIRFVLIVSFVVIGSSYGLWAWGSILSDPASNNDNSADSNNAPYGNQSTYSQTINMVYDVVGLTGVAAACTATEGFGCAAAVALVLEGSEAAATIAQEGCNIFVQKFGNGNQVDCSVTIVGPRNLVDKAVSEIQSGIHSTSGQADGYSADSSSNSAE